MLEKFLERQDFNSYEDLKENYKVICPQGFNFAYDVVDEWGRTDENKKALLYCDDFGTRKYYTFRELSLLSNKLANFFVSFGISKGDRVMLMLKQRAEVWMCFLALHKIGAVCIPATFQLTVKDIIYRCNKAEVKMICAIDNGEIIDFITQARPECKTLKSVAVVGEKKYDNCIDLRSGMEMFPDAFERIPNKNTDDMLIYFSSGTTGMPKMVMHDFTYPLGHIITAKYWQNVYEDTLHLTMSDSGWAKFGWGKIYGQWICGAVIVAYDNEKFDARNTLQLLEEIKATTFCAPPTVYRFLIKDDISKYDLSSVKGAYIAGEPLNPEVFYRFKELTGLTLTEGFGQSETPVLLANFPWFDIKPGSTGKPSPDYDIDIVDENGESCEDGIVGNIVIKNLNKHRPCGLFREYDRDPESNAKSFKNNSYDTGDTAWRDADGYYWFIGRNDDIIKCSGYRIGPFEVESAIMSFGGILECAVTAAPDPVRGQVVKATIVLTKDMNPSDELKKAIQEHVKKVTAPYKYPRIVEFATELPKTTSGKIKRATIRDDSDKK